MVSCCLTLTNHPARPAPGCTNYVFTDYERGRGAECRLSALPGKLSGLRYCTNYMAALPFTCARDTPKPRFYRAQGALPECN